MAVAGIIETRAYFRKQDADDSEPPRPRKRQRVVTPMPEFLPPLVPAQRELSPAHPPDNELLTPSPAPAPASSVNPTTRRVVRTALSSSWAGPADLHYDDDETFEDSNDVGHRGIQLEPIVSPVESESSDTDSDAEDGDFDLNRSEIDEGPDIFDTDVDLNATEHSE
jgi:hypothetical protein